jgi:hypothetical protein
MVNGYMRRRTHDNARIDKTQLSRCVCATEANLGEHELADNNKNNINSPAPTWNVEYDYDY